MTHREYPSRACALALAAVAALLWAPNPAVAQEAAAAEEPELVQEAAAGGAMTAEQLVEKNLEAKGGRERIESIESARLQGKMNMGGMEAPFTLEWKSPDKMRMELTLQGMTLVQAYDGASGWMVNPFMGKTTAEKMSAEDAEMFKDQADFHGPLVGWKEKGYTLEYEGVEDVEGTPAHKLVVTKPEGDEITLFLDEEYFLEIKQEAKREVRGQEVEAVVAVGDYKEVDGLVMAHSIDAVGAGGPGGAFNMTIETVELDPELADDRFAMPTAEESAAEPEGSPR